MAKTKDSLKKQLQAKAQRLRRHTKRANVFRQHNTYRNNAKKALQRAGKESHQYPEPSLTRRGRGILSKIWDNSKTHNDGLHWIEDQAKKNVHAPTSPRPGSTTRRPTHLDRRELELYKICPTMSLFMWEKMKPWRTIFHLNHNKGMMTSRPIEIYSGFYQGVLLL